MTSVLLLWGGTPLGAVQEQQAMPVAASPPGPLVCVRAGSWQQHVQAGIPETLRFLTSSICAEGEGRAWGSHLGKGRLLYHPRSPQRGRACGLLSHQESGYHLCSSYPPSGEAPTACPSQDLIPRPGCSDVHQGHLMANNDHSLHVRMLQLPKCVHLLSLIVLSTEAW